MKNQRRITRERVEAMRNMLDQPEILAREYEEIQEQKIKEPFVLIEATIEMVEKKQKLKRPS